VDRANFRQSLPLGETSGLASEFNLGGHLADQLPDQS
jgi:hypothetical protein